jgi:hypothetical protein
MTFVRLASTAHADTFQPREEPDTEATDVGVQIRRDEREREAQARWPQKKTRAARLDEEGGVFEGTNERSGEAKMMQMGCAASHF